MTKAAKLQRRGVLLGAVASPFVIGSARAADSLKAYSIWPENYARPMLEAFEKATGIHVNFIRFSSGEALARLIAEKGNPQVDVLFGGPVETFTAGEDQGIFDAYTPPSAADLPGRFKSTKGMWTAIADDPLVFMTNTAFLKDHGLKPPTSWNDLLNPAYKDMLQMADARTSGTAVTRIFSILQVNNRNEDAAFGYMKKLRKNVQAYTKSGGGGTVPVGLGQAGGGIFFIVDALFTRQKGYNVEISFPKEGIGSAAECIGLVKGSKNTAAAKKLIDWATSPAMQSLLAPAKINFLPANPKVAADPNLAAILKSANIIAIDDKWAGENRKRIVDRWVAEVLNAG
ncbi:MAG TPA: ABC transporter substrate-binding protein [Rhodopila sp.]|jgi:iron(III) transport system substrate-binding protein|nr:ABC transporter substrate-binding protein [Rhodopila sp.]